jgi:hypothetical protein
MTKGKSGSKTFRIAVLSFSTLMAVFSILAFGPKLLSLIPSAAPDLPPDREWEVQVMTTMFIVFILGYGIGWWQLLWGGILIILSALIVSLPFIIIESNYGSLIFGLPYFIIGGLYIILYRLGKQEKENK